MSQPTTKVYFKWVSFSPDKRQWKPSTPVIEPFDIGIVLDVPLTREYIYNSEQIIQIQLENEAIDVISAKLGFNNEPRPYLTPKGMRYCIDQFENEMSDKAEPTKVTADDNEEWEQISEIQTDEWK